tara:strand:- start:101 stop:673 length:573 start_codon:yes stop_codon:yes gene_type:complete
MAKFADTDLSNFENEFDLYFDDRFNRLINAVVSDLSTSIVSPVYTGYFASSWTARQNNVQREDGPTSDKNRRKKDPWADVYKKKTQGKGGAMTPWGVKKNMGEIKRRYPGPFYFNYKATPTVYIGNTTYYRAYALEDGNVIAYVQDMRPKIEEAFREKPVLGRVLVAAEPKERVAGAIPGMKKSTAILEP